MCTKRVTFLMLDGGSIYYSFPTENLLPNSTLTARTCLSTCPRLSPISEIAIGSDRLFWGRNRLSLRFTSHLRSSVRPSTFSPLERERERERERDGLGQNLNLSIRSPFLPSMIKRLSLRSPLISLCTEGLIGPYVDAPMRDIKGALRRTSQRSTCYRGKFLLSLWGSFLGNKRCQDWVPSLLNSTHCISE